MLFKESKEDFDLRDVVKYSRVQGLWRLLTGYRWLYLSAAGCLGGAALAQTAFFYLLRYATDEVMGQEGMGGQLPWLAAAFLGLALFQGMFTFLSGRWAAAAAEQGTKRLRDYLYDHLQRLSFNYHDQTSTGELIQRVTSDVDTIRRFYSEEAIGFGRILFLVVVNFIAMLNLDVRLTLYSTAVVPVVLVASIYFFYEIEQRYQLVQEQEAKLSTTLQENLNGIRVVKAFARQDYEQNKFEVDNHEKYVRGRRLLLMHALYWPVTGILVNGQLAVGLFIGAMMVINGEISVGTFMAYIGVFGWMMHPIRQVGRLITQMSMGLVSFERIAGILAEVKEPLLDGTHQPEGSLNGAVAFDELTFAYEGGGQPALQDISFAIEPGQTVALLGATGSGKTTLVNLLPRFYEYTDGSITLDGVELNRYSRHFLRREIGIVPQEPFLFSRTIRDNITYSLAREVTDEEVAAAARAAAVHNVILTFPQGYNTLVGEKGVTLSGGQKQRITLARTFLKDPSILILDDATSSVDTETEAEIRAALGRLMAGRTSFIIAHRVQSVMGADLILVLDQGRIVQRGTHETLLAEAGPYQRIHALQSELEDELSLELEGQPVMAWQTSGRQLPLAGD
ncbi:MAG TPA: ABC transporter ATP-binding protein [Anaerolineae bacterium]|nr:ABC transporter ATP-binding protein [Anaerolineae bacterium]